MSKLTVFVFGPPRLERDGKPMNISRRKVMGLLVYLAVSGQRHHRDALTTLLWPDYEAGKGRSYLRRLLSDLNKTLGPGILEVVGEEVGLTTNEQFQVDVRQFHTSLSQCQTHGHPAAETCADCIAPLIQAVNLYRDDFLAGFTLPDCAEFDDWQFFQGEGLRQNLLAALNNLMLWHQGQAEFEPALAYARRWLALDNLHEPAHQMVMQLYAQTGQPAAALRQYQLCVQLLDTELGVPPTAKTTALYEQIRAGNIGQNSSVSALPQPTSTPEVSAAPLPTEVERALFVGRESQLAELAQALAQTLMGQGQLRFVIGEAGAGKSALLNEFQFRAREQAGTLLIASGACDAQTGTSDPYLPFREILTALAHPESGGPILQEHGPDLIDTLVPASALGAHRNGQGRAPDAKPVEQSQIFDQAVKVLESIAARTPLVLILEDLHWVDDASNGLLFRLGRQLEGSRILLLGTYRSEEVSLGHNGEPHPLPKVLDELRRNLGSIHIDLDEARGTEGPALVDALLDAEPNHLDRNFRQALHEHTGGHPLFVVELLRDLQESGGLVQDADGCWEVGAALDWALMPDRVEGIIAVRMARLDDEERQLLTTASVMGEHFSAEVVAQALHIDSRHVALQLSGSLQKQHRLVVAEGMARVGRQRLRLYRFSHNLMQVYLYEQFDEVERGFLHEDIAYVLEELYGEQVNGIAAQLARHFQAAGVVEKAVDYLLVAGQQALRGAAYVEAERHFSQAVALLDDLPADEVDPAQAFSVHISLGEVLGVTRGRGTAEETAALTRALIVARQGGNALEISQTLAILAPGTHIRGDLALSQAYAEESQRLTAGSQDPKLQMLTNQISAHFEWTRGHMAQAAASFKQVVEFYRVHQTGLIYSEAQAMANALSNLGDNLAATGYPDQAVQYGQEAVALARRNDDVVGTLIALAVLLRTHLRRGDWSATIQIGQEALDLVGVLGDVPQVRTWVQSIQASAMIMLGDGTQGLDLARRAFADRLQYGLSMMPGNCAHVADACGQTGLLQEGLELIDQAFVQQATSGPMDEPKMYQIKGDLLLLQTVPEQQRAAVQRDAEDCLRKAIELARERGIKLWEARALASLCRLLESQGRDEGCRQELAKLYAWFTEGFEIEDMRVVKEVLDERE